MGFPAVGLLNSLKALLTPLIPRSIRCQRLLKGGAQGLTTRDIHQQTVATTAQDVDWTPIVGCHNRQAASSGFDQGQTKRFSQRWVDENTTAGGSPAIDPGDLRTAVVFRIGNLAIEILAINGFQHVLPFLTLAAL